MAGVVSTLNLEALQKLFRDMSWRRRRRSAVLLSDKVADTLQGELNDNLAGKGDFRMNGLFYLCASCGYLSANRKTECDACHTDDWLDLRDISVSKALRSRQRRNRNAIPLSVHILTAAIHLCVFVAITIGVTFSFPDDYNWANITHKYPLAGWYWVFTPILMLVSYFFIVRHVNGWLHRFSGTLPKRWHMPTDQTFETTPNELARLNVTGRCEGGATIIAPFSESKCIGYRISVLGCAPENSGTPEWLLEESRNAPCRLAGYPIGEDSLAFMTSGEQLNIESDDMQKNLRIYLHQHGLFPGDGIFWIFETVLTEGDTVSATVYPERQFGTVTRVEKPGVTRA